VAINTNITDLQEFLKHIITNTNMSCLNLPDDNNMVISLLFKFHSYMFL
jgi:hypothetical protein